MDEHAVMKDATTLVIERRLPGPIDRVWRYIVEPELRARWFAAGPMETKVGGKVRFEFDHRRISDEPTPEKYKDEEVTAMDCTVTRCEPPRLIAFTWQEGRAQRSEVTITLAEESGGVLLRLVHERLEGLETQIGVCAGWHAHLDLLVDLLEGRRPRDFWAHHMPLEDVYRKRLDA